jgi:2'-5' RNA ligase
MNDENTKIALVVELNGNLLDKTNYLLSRLEDRFSIKYIPSRSPSPHITLNYDFFIDDINSFKKSLSQFLSTRNKFNLKTNGFGVFVAKSPVIYLRWSIDKDLINLKYDLENFLLNLNKRKIIRNYYSDLNWIPKTTIAYNDSSYDNLQIVLKNIMESDLNGVILLDAISIYSYSEANGEKKIDKIYIE